MPSTLSKEEANSRSFRCGICLEEGIDSFKGYCLQSCDHRFCVSCLGSLVRVTIGNAESARASLRIPCPDVDCKQALTVNDIQYIFRDDRDSWGEYCNAANLSLLETEIAKKKGTRRCPAEHCNYTFCFEPSWDPNSQGTRFICPQCNSSFCLQCKANGGAVGPDHPGMCCAERIEQLQHEQEERRKFEQWKRENAQADARFQQLMQRESQRGSTKPCPRCSALVTKNGGCDHMYCTQCGNHYNWSAA